MINFLKLIKHKVGASAMSIVLLVITIVGVGIPITQQVIDTANLTGITATVVSFIPVFLALVVLVAAGRQAGLNMK